MPQPTHAIACGRSIARGLTRLTAAIALTAVGAAAQVPAQISIAVSATPSVSPPSLTFAWPSDRLAEW